MSAKKKYFTINFIYLIDKACQILSTFTNQFLCLHLHIHAFIFLSYTSLLSFHNISSLVPSTALDIQHFLKPVTGI